MPKVTVSKPIQRDIAPEEFFNGKFQATRSFNVTAAVGGRLASVNCQPGATVKKGDLLAQIDPRTYEAALAQAKGMLVRDSATLANARVDLNRYQAVTKKLKLRK